MSPRPLRLLVDLASCVLAMGALAGDAGLRFNRTRSVPVGLYWLDTFDRSATVGTYAAVCPPQTAVFEEAVRRGYVAHGQCPGGTAALLKVVAAGPGDFVEIRHDGVWINGKHWPDSTPLLRDAAGRPLPQLHGFQAVLDEDTLLLLSERFPNGFDGRYFGPVARALVLGRTTRLFE